MYGKLVLCAKNCLISFKLNYFVLFIFHNQETNNFYVIITYILQVGVIDDYLFIGWCGREVSDETKTPSKRIKNKTIYYITYK